MMKHFNSRELTNDEWVMITIYSNRHKVKNEQLEKALFHKYVEKLVHGRSDQFFDISNLDVLTGIDGKYYMKETVLAKCSFAWDFVLYTSEGHGLEFDEMVRQVEADQELLLISYRLSQALEEVAA